MDIKYSGIKIMTQIPVRYYSLHLEAQQRSTQPKTLSLAMKSAIPILAIDKENEKTFLVQGLELCRRCVRHTTTPSNRRHVEINIIVQRTYSRTISPADNYYEFDTVHQNNEYFQSHYTILGNRSLTLAWQNIRKLFNDAGNVMQRENSPKYMCNAGRGRKSSQWR